MDRHDANEQDLQQRIRAGDESAFDIVFRAHYSRLVRMAESIVGERAPAEEIAQEVMLELWRRRESLHVEQSFGAYLIRATRNRALNHVRHQRIVARELAAATLESSESPGTDADTLGVELERVVSEAIAALPARCREVFELSRVQGMRYVEIASVLDISVKTVEKRMGQALAELRERLAPWLGGGRGNPV
ncbi:MAG TPA: RNA polymerase sigma-70 factor [Gemmatimonadaceae bacterium]|nr:RNA polymerase sigma-70 factor [Gemmatimonadaceae bacterium]